LGCLCYFFWMSGFEPIICGSPVEIRSIPARRDRHHTRRSRGDRVLSSAPEKRGRKASLFWCADKDSNRFKCGSPGFTKDIFTGLKCTVYLQSIYQDSLRCSSIYHGSRCRFESHDRRNLSAKQKILPF